MRDDRSFIELKRVSAPMRCWMKAATASCSTRLKA